MPGNTWYKLGDMANDVTGDLYYRGQRIREAYYRGEQIWGEEFLGILLARLPDKLHYPGNGGLLGIDITKLPDKTHYTTGEDFDYSGSVVIANYTDGSAIDITSQCAFIPATEILNSEVSTNITVAQTEDEPIDYSGIKVLGVWTHSTEDITEKCEFFPPEGTLIDKSTALLGIIVARLPNKTIYAAGESLDYSGVMVLAVYADGHTVDITSECEFNPSSEKLVRSVHMVGILVIRLPTGTEDNPYEGVEVTAFYSNGQFVDVTEYCTMEAANVG